MIGELRARSQRGLPGVGRLLRDPAVRRFGSTRARSPRPAARRGWGYRMSADRSLAIPFWARISAVARAAALASITMRVP